MTTAMRLRELKSSDQDFEWYPTTEEIIEQVAEDIDKELGRYERCRSILDVGAGDGRVLVSLREHLSKHHECPKLFAIEKATCHLNEMPKTIAVIGTEFFEQTLIDKEMTVVFCNPPYSQYQEWATQILREGNTRLIYLVIPDRWEQSDSIKHALKSRDAKTEIIGEFNFLQADRKARANVHVLRIEFSRSCNPFESVMEGLLPELDVFTKAPEEFKDTKEYAKARRRQMTESGDGLIDSLVKSYDKEMAKLLENYQGVLRLDIDILDELGVTKVSVLDGIRERVKGLKNKYWKTLFDEMKTVTQRLSTKQRKAFLDALQNKVGIDFTTGNVYATLIWVSKWANDYYDEQLIDLFRTLSTDSNCEKYKSNQKVWTEKNWRYRSCFSEEGPTHFKLEYRIVVEHGGISTGEYDFETCNGLVKYAGELLSDIVTVANTLGFACDASPRDFQWSSGKSHTFPLRNGKPLIEVKAFKNRNMHFRFNPEVMMAINIEAGRLLGWIRNPMEACREMDLTGEDACHAAKSFGSLFHIAPDAGLSIEYKEPTTGEPEHCDNSGDPAREVTQQELFEALEASLSS